MNSRVALCLPYFENPGILRLHLETWAGYPYDVRSRFVFIIVDDASPTWPAAEVLKADPINAEIELYRIKQNIPWGWPAAKNIAMKHAPRVPALITDIDHVLECQEAERLLAMEVMVDSHYVPARRRASDRSPYKRHPGSYIMQRELFWRIGGYEEAWLGYYGTDFLMRNRAAKVSKRIETDAVTMTLYGRDDVPDASTTCFGRKGSPLDSGAFPQIRMAMRASLDGEVIRSLSQEYERVL